jgi:hypothetical protein
LIDDLLPLYGPDEFASPTRSTVPLLSFLKHGGPLLQDLLAETVGGSDPAGIHVEYTVDPPKGQGKASQTDAMLLRNEHACALEAKWTEPPYSDVRTWIAEGKNRENREAVLSGWLSLLQDFTGRALKVEDFGQTTYQMVHRAASACAAGRRPFLAYLQFSPLPGSGPVDSGPLRRGLSHLKALLGAPSDWPWRCSRSSSSRRPRSTVSCNRRRTLQGAPSWPARCSTSWE